MKSIRTRIAPSPTGFLHIGSIYQMLFDKVWAEKHNGQFILRIEDTDQKRYVEDAEKAIYSAVDWMGLTPDESPEHGGEFGPYRQSERLPLYQKYADEMIEKGHAYYCFCTQERLEQVRNEQIKQKKVPMYDKHCRNIPLETAKQRIANGEKYVVRMKIPENTKIVVKDLIRGDIEFDSNGIDDQVIIKSDGFPTYHLAVVVDDHLMQISNVVRGPEWIASYPKHKLLYDYFGWEMPEFFHTPLITNMNGAKLSKRQGHASIDWYRRKGFLPQAIINFISLLGWSHPEEKEIFSFDEFQKYFEFKDVSPVSPKFDLTKLEWMNGQYIQNLSDEDFFARVNEWLNYVINNPQFLGATEYETNWNMDLYKNLRDFINGLDGEKKNLFAHIMKTRLKKFEDILDMGREFFDHGAVEIKSITKQKSASEVKQHLEEVRAMFEKSGFDLESLKSIESELVKSAETKGWKVGEIFYPVRLAVMRSTTTPPLFESIFILGKEHTLTNLSEAIGQL